MNRAGLLGAGSNAQTPLPWEYSDTHKVNSCPKCTQSSANPTKRHGKDTHPTHLQKRRHEVLRQLRIRVLLISKVLGDVIQLLPVIHRFLPQMISVSTGTCLAALPMHNKETLTHISLSIFLLPFQKGGIPIPGTPHGYSGSTHPPREADSRTAGARTPAVSWSAAPRRFC